MADRPYHHGNLRTTLLAEAERPPSATTASRPSRCATSPARLASATPRRAVASPTARPSWTPWPKPDSRAPGRRDAQGHRRRSQDYEARLRAVAVEATCASRSVTPPCWELMFGAKNAEPPETLRAAAERVFTAFGDLIDQGQAGRRAYAGRSRTSPPALGGRHAGHRRARHVRPDPTRPGGPAPRRRDRALHPPQAWSQRPGRPPPRSGARCPSSSTQPAMFIPRPSYELLHRRRGLNRPWPR